MLRRRGVLRGLPVPAVVQAARAALRALLTHTGTEEEISKNVASPVKAPKPRRRRIKPRSVVETGASSPIPSPAKIRSPRPGSWA